VFTATESARHLYEPAHPVLSFVISPSSRPFSKPGVHRSECTTRELPEIPLHESSFLVTYVFLPQDKVPKFLMTLVTTTRTAVASLPPWVSYEVQPGDRILTYTFASDLALSSRTVPTQMEPLSTAPLILRGKPSLQRSMLHISWLGSTGCWRSQTRPTSMRSLAVSGNARRLCFCVRVL